MKPRPPRTHKAASRRIQSLYRIAPDRVLELTVVAVPTAEAGASPESQDPGYERHDLDSGVTVFVRVFA